MNFHLEKLISNSNKTVLLLSAGMPRSGSTWLYNATRLLLLNSRLTKDITSYGWIQDLPVMPPKKIMLIKLHNFDRSILALDFPKFILYSYRDLRDALASAQRKDNRPSSLLLAESFVQNDLLWRRHADFTMRYESMINNQHDMLTKLAEALAIQADTDYEDILFQIRNLSYDNPGRKNHLYHMENLLHKRHFTDGRHGSWEKCLDDNFVKQIESKYLDWFLANNYPI